MTYSLFGRRWIRLLVVLAALAAATAHGQLVAFAADGPSKGRPEAPGNGQGNGDSRGTGNGQGNGNGQGGGNGPGPDVSNRGASLGASSRSPLAAPDFTGLLQGAPESSNKHRGAPARPSVKDLIETIASTRDAEIARGMPEQAPNPPARPPAPSPARGPVDGLPEGSNTQPPRIPEAIPPVPPGSEEHASTQGSGVSEQTLSEPPVDADPVIDQPDTPERPTPQETLAALLEEARLHAGFSPARFASLDEHVLDDLARGRGQGQPPQHGDGAGDGGGGNLPPAVRMAALARERESFAGFDPASFAGFSLRLFLEHKLFLEHTDEGEGNGEGAPGGTP